MEILTIATRQMLADSGTPRSISNSEAGKNDNGDYNDARFFNFDFDDED